MKSFAIALCLIPSLALAQTGVVTKQDLDRGNELCMQHRMPSPALPNGRPRTMPLDAIPAFEPGYEQCAAIVSMWRSLLAGERAAGEKQIIDDLSKRLPK